MFQFRTLCNVAQTSAKRGQTLFEIVFSRSALLYDVIQKIEFEPENFEIFKTETVAQSQNLLARIYFQLVVWQCFANSNLRLLSDEKASSKSSQTLPSWHRWNDPYVTLHPLKSVCF